MEAELIALASSGVATLMGLMVSDSWTQAKEGIARILARGKDVREVTQDLDDSRADLLAAKASGDEVARTSIEGQWRKRLCCLLEADPGFGQDLRGLVEAVEALPPEGPIGTIHNVVSGGVQHGPVIQAGRISGVAFHAYGSSSTADRNESEDGE